MGYNEPEGITHREWAVDAGYAECEEEVVLTPYCSRCNIEGIPIETVRRWNSYLLPAQERKGEDPYSYDEWPQQICRECGSEMDVDVEEA